MKIRSGGHDYEGVSYVSDVPFFILDMFNFRSINVSIEIETAWVQVGAILGEVYYRIAEKSNVHGFPAGVCPTVGVGGGYGDMIRKYGLSVDNIIDAQIIDVNGRILDRVSMGEDLFWAITGGGGSSYGVVLAYKIKLVRVPSTVTVFRVTRTYEQNLTNIVYSYQQVTDKLPKEIFVKMTLDVVKSSVQTGEKTNRATFLTLFLGDSEKLLSIMNETFPDLGLKQSDCTEMSWIESVIFWTNFPAGTPVIFLLSRVPQVLTHLKRKYDYLKTPIPKL
ncbi:FAD-binding Berberine family protein [Forsythia ovata]|uniref:FAD-binding Berberine family protein n=1 Tax=Forsythia ovata TaxID=205694 RepID=A0ABD1S1B2_9LAMI